MSLRLQPLLLTFLVIGCSPSPPVTGGRTADPNKGSVAVAANLVREGKTNACYMRLKLENRSGRQVRFPGGYLPWVAYSVVLVLIEADGPVGKSLDQYLMCESYGIPKEVVIDDGKSIEDQIDLNLRFPSLANALARHDVILFWSYQMPERFVPGSQREGGMILIPRKEVELGSGLSTPEASGQSTRKPQK